MPPTVEDRLRDILEAIAEIQAMLAGCNLDLFTADKMRRMATERYLEIICEAARRVTDDVKQDAPEIAWQRMTDFGNQLRHGYHAIDVEIVWDIVQLHLPALKAFVERRIRTSGN
jgi:uncharacterized protein with HEPN domain